jgi:peptide deformylase
MLRVTQYGESVLRKKGEKVTAFDAQLRKLAADMVEIMHNQDGAGLAAQQVGRILELFVIDLGWHEGLNDLPYELDGRHPPLDLLMPMVFVNASVTPLKSELATAEEGCLSFPEIRAEVTRPDRIRCEYQDLDGAKHTLQAGDWLARVIQHEFDHTQGVLFIDRMDRETLRAIDTPLKRLRREGRSLEKTDREKRA